MPPQPRILAIEGHQIAVHSINLYNPGPALVFLHGITSSVNFWLAGQTPQVDSFPWHSLSLPGHYPSMLPDGFRREDLTARSLARVLAGAIRELTCGQPAVLIGHSTGGFAALAVAAYHPELVQRVVSVSGFACGRWTGILGTYQRWMRTGGALGYHLFRLMFPLALRSEQAYRWALRFYVGDRSVCSDPALDEVFPVLYAYAAKLDLAQMRPYFERMPDIDITADLARIRVPVTAIAGTCDPIVPPQQARIIAETAPQGDLVLLGGVGHLPMLEQPAAYHHAINTVLDTVRCIPQVQVLENVRGR